MADKIEKLAEDHWQYVFAHGFKHGLDAVSVNSVGMDPRCGRLADIFGKE